MSNKKEWAVLAMLICMSAAASPVCAKEPSSIGREIYSSNVVLINTKDFKSDEPEAVGLYILGDKVKITQRGNISLTGAGAVGIRLDGTDSKVTTRSGTQINSEGLNGTGILIYGGRGHNLILEGDITAAGNAIELSEGVQLNEISLSGKLTGG